MNFKKLMNRFIKAEEPEEIQPEDTVDSIWSSPGYNLQPNSIIHLTAANTTSTTGPALYATPVRSVITSCGTITATVTSGLTTYTYYEYDYELAKRARKIFAVPEFEIL